MARWSRTLQSGYICLGYILPLSGAALGIVFVAINGSKFGPRSIPVTVGSRTVWEDGPPEYYLLSFWLFTCLQVVVVIANVLGPCSCDTSLHFAFQTLGLVCDFVYLTMANTSVEHWPENAQVWSPRLYFNVSALAMLFGQAVLVWGAYQLSGLGCSRERGRKMAEVRGRLQRLERFKPVWQGSRYSLSNGGGWLGEGNGSDDDEGMYGYDVDDEEMYVGDGGDDYDGEEEDGRGLAGGYDLDEEDEEYLLEAYPNTLKALELRASNPFGRQGVAREIARGKGRGVGRGAGSGLPEENVSTDTLV